MACNLILVRHAKSSWKDLGQSDHDRPLNNRGRASAHALGNWLRSQELVPDHVITSSAMRACETHDHMALGPLSTKIERGLYLAGADVMLRHLQNAKGNMVMMVGHNPGISEFAELLAVSLPSHPEFRNYPTAATTVFKFDIQSWENVRFGSGTVTNFTVPRDLI